MQLQFTLLDGSRGLHISESAVSIYTFRKQTKLQKKDLGSIVQTVTG
jgi:hypothetical protein